MSDTRTYPVTPLDALDRIWDIVHTPTKATAHRAAERHFMADFDEIRKIIKEARHGSAQCQGQPLVWRFEAAKSFIWGKDGKPGVYADWEWRVSATEPNMGDGMRNVTPLYAVAVEQPTSPAVGGTQSGLHEFSMTKTDKRIEVLKLLHELRLEGEATGDVFLRGLHALKSQPDIERVRDEWCAEYVSARTK